jgi:predicted regulator of Ras-like GTPase activity (Roadblock/LC7/MglB family)
MNQDADEGRRLSDAAAQLLADLPGARAVLLASADGFEVAAAGLREDGARLAAMTSSIAAIAEVVTRETALGAPRCLVIDAEGGHLLVRTLQVGGQSLVLNVLTGHQALLGLAMHLVQATARRLEQA